MDKVEACEPEKGQRTVTYFVPNSCCAALSSVQSVAVFMWSSVPGSKRPSWACRPLTLPHRRRDLGSLLSLTWVFIQTFHLVTCVQFCPDLIWPRVLRREAKIYCSRGSLGRRLHLWAYGKPSFMQGEGFPVWLPCGHHISISKTKTSPMPCK